MTSNYFKFAVAASVAVASSLLIYNYYQNDKKKKSSTAKKTNFDVPIIDLNYFFNCAVDPISYQAECKKVAQALHQFGLVIIKDPRVSEADNDRFINLMERYFEGSDGIRDARPEHHFQVGVTPAFTEKPRDHCFRLGAYGPDDKPLSPCPPELDPKWRFFWRTGPMPKQTEFSSHNMDAVIPPEFPE